MPERSSGPETDDLDAVFRGLVADVGAQSRRPGADRAVRTAGARRTAAVASALVVVLVLLGGFGGWVLQGSRRVGVPAGGPPSTTATASAATSHPDGDVPGPASMTVDGLNAATAGWTTWQEGTAGRPDVPRCLTQATSPVRTESERYHSGTSADATLKRLRFASRSDSNAAMLATVQAFDACPEGTGLQDHDVSADLEVVAFTWGRGDRRGVVWLVNFGDRMDVLHVSRAPRAPEDVFLQVSRLIAADVQVP